MEYHNEYKNSSKNEEDEKSDAELNLSLGISNSIDFVLASSDVPKDDKFILQKLSSILISMESTFYAFFIFCSRFSIDEHLLFDDYADFIENVIRNNIGEESPFYETYKLYIDRKIAAMVIQRACASWIDKPICNDGKEGIAVRIGWRKCQ